MGEIYVGTSGWSYPDWKGVVYPRNARELRYLARYFDTVEINTSFYRPLDPDSCHQWLSEVAVNPRFKFTAKLWQRFTHERTAIWTAEDVTVFKQGIAPLHRAGKLGVLLIQFPWGFTNTQESRAWLVGLVKAFEEFPLVVEVRHVTWQNEEAMEFFRKQSLNFCNIDQPVTQSSIGPTSIATGPIAYYRFHGRNHKDWFAKDAGSSARYDYLYSEEELSPWIEQIRHMAGNVRELYVMMNNHFKGQAPANALQILAALSGKPVAAPEPLLAAFPHLKKVTKGQRMLI